MKHILQLVLTLFISFSSFSQVCVHSITNATPLQGTNGTQVTINGTNFTASSIVSINGNPASSVTFIDANTLIASVANGTTSGPIEVTDSSCTTTFGTFTELNDANSCSVMFSDIIISEVFDNNGGSLGYIEVFNGTGSPVNLSNYTIDRYGDLSTTTVTHTYTFPNGLIIQDQEALVGRINSGGSGIEDFDYENTTNGFNADDRLELFNNGTLIDDFHDEIDGTVGYVYRRNTDISGPNPNFTTSEWTTFTEGDESDLGIYNASSVPPLINTQPSDSSDCTASFSVSATASNGGMLSYQWYFNENNGSNTNFIEVNSTNLPSVTISGETSTMLTLTGNTNSIDNYQFFVLITEVGGCSNYSDTAIFTYQDNIAPVPDITPLATLTDQCQIDMLTAPTATDNCVGSVTGTTTTTTPITSSTTITWTYTDANGNSSTQDQDVVINDTTAPVADNDPLPTVTEECQVDSIAAPTATDNCDGQVTGTATTPFPITSSTTVTWTYTDANGNSSTQDQDVLINDTTAPVADNDPLPTVTEECQVDSIAAPTATDNCDGQVTGTTTTPFPITSSTTVTWTYTDSNGNSSTQDQDVLINDTTAPVADNDPLPTVTEECQVDSIAAPTATDNCDGQVTGTTTTPFPITSSTTVTWTYTDANGNSSTQDQNVVINDTTAPVADNDPLPTVTEECQVDSIAAPTATDNCDGQVTATTSTPFPITSSTTVTWTYTDSNGNSSTQDQDVVINFPQIDSMANVNECQSFTLPTITGNNLSGNEMYYTGSNGAGTSYSSGTVLNFEDFQNYPVTLYIYDEALTTPSCFSEETFTLTLQDCEPPVILPPNEILIPEFLTPNNDGFNDVWNVRNVFTIDPKAQVYIFDRYGKLLKALSQSEPFWDGTFHGKQMPSNDYWYLVQLINEDSSGLPMSQQLKGHFTLKR
jgi:gliding motility-associated-like protein